MKDRKLKNTRNANTMVAEPAVSYALSTAYVTNTSTGLSSQVIKRPVALLGLSFTKPYSEVQTQFDFIECIRQGLPKKALDNLVSVAGFTTNEIAHIIHTSDRTLRRYTSSHKLDSEQSERVLELAKLYSRGEEIFGTLDSFKSWMDREVVAFGNKKPKSLLDTSLGIEMLMDELGRIEHGVFA